jgi:hypothetical protein
MFQVFCQRDFWKKKVATFEGQIEKKINIDQGFQECLFL